MTRIDGTVSVKDESGVQDSERRVREARSELEDEAAPHRRSARTGAVLALVTLALLVLSGHEDAPVLLVVTIALVTIALACSSEHEYGEYLRVMGHRRPDESSATLVTDVWSCPESDDDSIPGSRHRGPPPVRRVTYRVRASAAQLVHLLGDPADDSVQRTDLGWSSVTWHLWCCDVYFSLIDWNSQDEFHEGSNPSYLDQVKVRTWRVMADLVRDRDRVAVALAVAQLELALDRSRFVQDDDKSRVR